MLTSCLDLDGFVEAGGIELAQTLPEVFAVEGAPRPGQDGRQAERGGPRRRPQMRFAAPVRPSHWQEDRSGASAEASGLRNAMLRRGRQKRTRVARRSGAEIRPRPHPEDRKCSRTQSACRIVDAGSCLQDDISQKSQGMNRCDRRSHASLFGDRQPVCSAEAPPNLSFPLY